MKALKLTMLAAFASCLLSTTQSNAQNIYIGIKAGANFSQTKGDHLENGFKGHFLGGAVAGVKFSMLRVQGELLFTQTSLTTGDDFASAFGQYLTTAGKNVKNGTYKQSELAVPVTIGFQIVPKLLWLYAGPQFSGVVSTTNVDAFFNDTKSVVKKGYVSGVVGADLQLPFKLNVGARYVFGLSDINNVGDVGGSWKERQIQIHAGITLFNLL